MSDLPIELIMKELDKFDIEVPSWGFRRAGTRFETYCTGDEPQTLRERIKAAGKVHRLTGKGKKVALHFPWDGEEEEDIRKLKKILQEENLEAGAVNANLFSIRKDSPLDSRLRFGSLISPFSDVREAALEHISECIRWMRILGSKTLILWLPNGSNSFGQTSFFDMFDRVLENVKKISKELNSDEMMLLEYKPFEPAMYATAVFDWGAATSIAKLAGDNTKVLVDLGHHLQAANVEQIVAYLVKIGELGGFHFNDRKYADDDLITGSLNPAQLFRILCTLQEAYKNDLIEQDDISFMIDQSHYLKDPSVAMIESIENILIGFLKSLLVDFQELAERRSQADITGADRIVQSAFRSDVRPALNQWRQDKGLAEDPIKAYRNKRTREF